MKAIRDLLAEHPFFAGLDDADVDLLAGCGRLVRFDVDERLGRAGDPADTFFVLRSGRVALEVPAPGESIVIETLGSGQLVGASWLFAPHQWQFDARALEAGGAIALDAACLRGKCDDDHRLGYELMSRFADLFLGRLQATRLRLLDVYGHREPV